MTTLIYGPPCGGKTDLVQQLRIRGDLVLDFDKIHAALSGLDPYDHHDSITPFVVEAMDAVKRRLQTEKDTTAWVIACAPTRAERSEFSSFTDNVRLAYADRTTCHDRAATAGRPNSWHASIDSWHDRHEPDLPERNDPMPIERRTADEGVELREEGGTLTAVGYAAAFNRLSQNLGGFVERGAPATFRSRLNQSDVRALFNHEPDHLLGRSSTGTLRLSEDDHGLRYEVDLPATTLGRDVAELLRRGDISGSSFGFRTISDEWGETDDGYPLRTLTEVALRDGGPGTCPAYSSTEASLRSLADDRELDLTDLIKAAKANNLRDLIFPTDDQEPGDTHSYVRHPGTIR